MSRNQTSWRDQTGANSMYVVGDGVKQDPVRRWSLPDRVFFACGACHILAYAFLKAYPGSGFAPLWIKPSEGFTGNHIVVVRDDLAFDYHGFSGWSHLLGHMEAKANRWWPGWSGALISIPMDVLISESKSRGTMACGFESPASSCMTPCPEPSNSCG